MGDGQGRQQRGSARHCFVARGVSLWDSQIAVLVGVHEGTVESEIGGLRLEWRKSAQGCPEVAPTNSGHKKALRFLVSA